MSSTSPPTILERAERLARDAHAGQLRKGGGVPYVSHLESVARRLAAFGVDDERVLAAAWLHDVLEDQPAHAERVRAEMPADVVTTVELLSEQKTDASGAKRAKPERFAGYVAGLAAATRGGEGARPEGRAACLVSLCDKIDNVEGLIASERAGEGLLTRLRTRPGEHATQLASLREVYSGVVPAHMLAAYDAAARGLAEYVRAWLPGRALDIATSAHLGQFDKAGAPYALHPLRLALRAETDEERMVAALHDVVEDSPWTLAELALEGFPPPILDAIERVTRRGGESYEAFVARAAHDPIARKVKLYDLEDNLDTRRIRALGPEDVARIERYHRARSVLLTRIAAEQASRADAAKGGLLAVKLDEASHELVCARAAYPDLRGDHVTLGRGVGHETPAAAWIPGGGAIGDVLEIQVAGEARALGVQALLVSIAGTTTRPRDAGRLHVTVSLQPPAEARHSNGLLAWAPVQPLEGLVLRGTVTWKPPAPPP